MNERAKRILIWWLGWFFIVLGLLGLVLPVLQGILFLLIGLSLLSQSSPWAARLLDKLKKRFPRTHSKFEEAKEKSKQLQARIFKKKDKQADSPE